MAREFGSKNRREVAVISADDKCKIALGPPAVNRLTKINKFFLHGDDPDMPDHDERSGQCVVPNGYMILQFREDTCMDFRPTLSVAKMSEEPKDDEEDGDIPDTPDAVEEDWEFPRGHQVYLDPIVEDLEVTQAHNTFQEDIEEVFKGYQTPGEEETEVQARHQVYMDPVAEDFEVPYIEMEGVGKDTRGFDANDNMKDVTDEICEEEVAVVKKKIDLCFCLETSHKCSTCKRRVCNFCSPNADSDSRKCRTCFNIPQTDGADEESDSDDDIIGRKQINRQVIRDDDEEETDIDNNLVPEDLMDEEEEYTFRTIKDETGRQHVPYPANGKSYVYLKSNTYDPSTIEGHVNDLINLFATDTDLKGKKGLVLILDDGADYGIRSYITMHYLGKLFIKLNLDLLLIVKNAPKDSRFNPIEHLWGYFSKKLAGMVLPLRLIGEDDDKTLSEDSVEVNNQAIDILTNTFKNKKFNGFPIVPVSVHCNAEKVVIGEDELDHKTFDELEQDKDFYDSNLSQRRVRDKDPETMKEARLIAHHMDKRSHSLFYRKCMKELGDKPCTYCKEFPPSVSPELIMDLPRREDGGLFFDVAEDPVHPGHNRTFLNHIGRKYNIVPDGDIDVERCKVKSNLLAIPS